MPKSLVLTLVAIVMAGVIFMALRPQGEEADWERLVALLGEPYAWEPPGAFDNFASATDQEETSAQVEAIRNFAKSYPLSPRVDQLLEEYILSALWIDAHKGGLSLEHGDFIPVHQLAWEIHQLSPDLRRGFEYVIEARLAEVPDAGIRLEQLGEFLKNDDIIRRAGIVMQQERQDFRVAARDRARQWFNKMSTPTAAQRALRDLLSRAKSQDAAIELIVRGPNPGEDYIQTLSRNLGTDFVEQTGLITINADEAKTTELKKLGHLEIVLDSSVEMRPVIVRYYSDPQVIKTKELTYAWSNPLQRWESQWQTKTTVKEGDVDVSQEKYPVVKVQAKLTRDNEVLWQASVDSAWRWQRDYEKHQLIGSAIAKGSEAASSSLRYSANNLSKKIVFELLGVIFD